MKKITLLGRFCQDPDIRITATGKKMCNFSVAVSDNYKNNQGEYETSFFNCTIFGDKRINYVENYFRKGSRVLVEGDPKINKSGDKSYLNILVSEITKIDYEPKNTVNNFQYQEIEDEEMPF